MNKQIHGDDPPPSPPPIGRDRGPAAFFHGRESIRSRFNPILSESTTHNAGTIFLIQGTPRAGKTALIDVLSHQAETKGWTVVKIAVQNLYTPVSLHSLWGQRTRLIKRSTTIEGTIILISPKLCVDNLDLILYMCTYHPVK